jgi:23S rRNA (adenine2503-C2)-methyltransferase
VNTAQKINLLDLTRQDLEALFEQWGEKPFRSSQVIKWLHQYGVEDIQSMTNLSKSLRAQLEEQTHISAPKIVLAAKSDDGTHKWVLEMDSGNHVETVFIPERDRGTLCVSTQIGCALACTFCSTGRQGFNRNLSVHEIIGQIWLANKALGRDPKGQRIITNIVFMGMGEPLLNFDNLMKSINLLLDDFAYGLSKRRVTISTSGVVPAIQRLREFTDVYLALSLHAPNDPLREALVPLNKKYPLKEVLDACIQYVRTDAHKRLTVEYVMIDGFNDKPEHARQLVKLLRNLPVKINLIPFNPFPGSDFKRSTPQALEVFREILSKNNLTTTTRKTRGDDIDAACGQLVGLVKDKSKRTQHQVTMRQGVA